MNKGAMYAIASAFFVSTSFVFTKYLLNYIAPEFLMMLWFSSAAVFSAILAYAKTKENPLANAKEFWKEGLLIGFFNACSAILWILSINFIGPSLTSFLLRLMTIFMIMLGIVFLREKMNSIEALGAAISIIGALIISFKTNDIGLLGMGLAIAASLSIAVQEFIAKIYVKKIKPYQLTSVRTMFTAGLLIAFVTATGKLQPIGTEHLLMIAIGSILSAVLGYLFFFEALDKMDISKVAIIRTLDPFIVVFYVFILFQSLPSAIQLIGGVLIVAGVIISELSMDRLRQVRKALPW